MSIFRSIFYSQDDYKADKNDPKEPIYTRTIYDEEIGFNLFPFCRKIYQYSQDLPPESLCKMADKAYILYYNLSQVGHL